MLRTRADSRPEVAATWSNMAVALEKMGLHERALQCLQRALTLDPTLAVAWNVKATLLTSVGQHERALESVVRALELDPLKGGWWYDKGKF